MDREVIDLLTFTLIFWILTGDTRNFALFHCLVHLLESMFHHLIIPPKPSLPRPKPLLNKKQLTDSRCSRPLATHYSRVLTSALIPLYSSSEGGARLVGRWCKVSPHYKRSFGSKKRLSFSINPRKLSIIDRAFLNRSEALIICHFFSVQNCLLRAETLMF